ncbi:hypothetical protein CALCODRAFT_487344 [Calocera cornea HHB12733]|uniref:Uncharacterized protein n=1 Tax=Calocera cornea HHB12733 TaxID=1353952 RepID=A0A165D703_9BASI|nr:hypothetical protein CALCODRAFT_489022 [Calocera cornea HHB12733]KZT51621.1 hypothetical protein CALCODRAFT_487757 [Calocera cornea HHB12733]KZT52195.1 hypothetical protein CALCODRAFT_487344 [Calocera cornea HHB12733]
MSKAPADIDRTGWRALQLLAEHRKMHAQPAQQPQQQQQGLDHAIALGSPQAPEKDPLLLEAQDDEQDDAKDREQTPLFREETPNLKHACEETHWAEWVKRARMSASPTLDWEEFRTPPSERVPSDPLFRPSTPPRTPSPSPPPQPTGKKLFFSNPKDRAEMIARLKAKKAPEK